MKKDLFRLSRYSLRKEMYFFIQACWADKI